MDVTWIEGFTEPVELDGRAFGVEYFLSTISHAASNVGFVSEEMFHMTIEHRRGKRSVDLRTVVTL